MLQLVKAESHDSMSSSKGHITEITVYFSWRMLTASLNMEWGVAVPRKTRVCCQKKKKWVLNREEKWRFIIDNILLLFHVYKL